MKFVLKRVWPIFAIIIPLWMMLCLSLIVAISVVISWEWILLLWMVCTLFLSAVFALTFEDGL